MVQIGTLAKVMVALSFPCVGIAYYTQHKVKSNITTKAENQVIFNFN